MEHFEIVAAAILRAHLAHPVAAVFAWTFLYLFATAFYNLYLHPLRKYPGPLAARASVLWKASKSASGTLAHTMTELHDKYGPVVRLGPNELSFVESQAWKDIYGHHGSYEMAKDPKFYRTMGDGEPRNIITSDRTDHGILRRHLSHSFSERSMRAQEPIIGNYVDLLIRRLEEHSKGGSVPLDMRSWFNFTTFDIIGNLGFGSDFGCLENSHYHPWVDTIAKGLKELMILQILIRAIPGRLIYALSKAGMFKARAKNVEYSHQKLEDRIAIGMERPDLIEGLIRKKDLSMGELVMNAQLIITAGSETTATLLSGALFFIASAPEVKERLINEVRTSFSSEREITLLSVNHLNYMLACLNESLRMYPPVPVGLPRVVPKGGHEIAGHWVPEDVTVSVWQLAAYYSKRNFTDPETFNPNRFLGDPKFANDDLSVLQPFSVGPRNCIGKNLAYAEMRLIMARLLFRFDVELSPEAKNWNKQNIYTLWDKPELPVYLSPVKV